MVVDEAAKIPDSTWFSIMMGGHVMDVRCI